MQQQMNLAELNARARAIINAVAVPREQQIFSTTYAANGTDNISNTQPVVNVQPRMVGLARGFIVQVTATITNGSAVQLNLADWGPANVLSQIQFQDLQNNTRIQIPGWACSFLNSVKQRKPFSASLIRTTGFDYPVNYGDNMAGQISAPATIAAGATGTITMWYYIPLSYGEKDLRGSVYLNVVNATAQLQLTFNTAPVVAAGADSTQAVYIGDAAGSVALARISGATVTVLQDYLDQIPMGQNGAAILPPLDLATIYDLKQTQFSAITAGQDFPIQYANYRDFHGTYLIYVNTAEGGVRGNGSDINYWALQSANYTNIWKRTPARIANLTRNLLGVDPPPGAYYFSSRERPISTQQYGNMEIVLNASTAGAGAYVLAFFESLAVQNNIVNAGSLPAA